MEALPAAVRAHLERGAIGEAGETIKSGDPRLDASTYTLVGNRLMAVDGAVRAAESAGYQVVVLPDPTTGEARDTARRFVQAAADPVDLRVTRWMASFFDDLAGLLRPGFRAALGPLPT